jgi:hypothetical protein
MPKKSLLLNTTTFDHFAAIHKAMRSDPLKPFLTKTQGDAIAHGVDETIGFPADIALEQRTPKGTIYVFNGRALAFLIDQRGTFLRSRRDGVKTTAKRKILVTL